MRLVNSLPRSVVTSWQPTNLFESSSDLSSAGATLIDQLNIVSVDLATLSDDGSWTGQTYEAARSRVDTVWKAADADSAAMDAISAEITAGVHALTMRKTALLNAVAMAELDGCMVGEDWSVSSATSAASVSAHAATIKGLVSDLERADRDAADAVVHAADQLVNSGGARNFVPIVIGLGFLIELAIEAAIAAGYISLGVLLFGLIDRFGEGAWDTIRDSIPNYFFSDAGPVDEGGVQELLNSETQPGRTPPHRQLDTDQQVRDLYDELAEEGRAIDLGSYPGVGVELPDGTIVRIRGASSSGGATIDIKYPDAPKPVKVHVK